MGDRKNKKSETSGKGGKSEKGVKLERKPITRYTSRVTELYS